jgi:hypothetical protein
LPTNWAKFNVEKTLIIHWNFDADGQIGLKKTFRFQKSNELPQETETVKGYIERRNA